MQTLRIAGLVLVIVLSAKVTASAQAKVYKEVEVKNGGSIAGHVAFVGEVPHVTLPITKNPEVCCAEGEKEKPSPRLVVGKEGVVANAVAFLTEVPEGKPFPDRKPTLDQRKCVFEPHVLLVPKGAKLSIRNDDTILHNAHAFLKQSDVFNLAFATKDQTIDVPMRREGLVTMRCDAGHNWMSGFIFVISHPYYAVTDDQGRFNLENVPPGKYTLRVWHEGWKLEKKVEPYAFSKDVELDVPVQVADGAKLALELELKDDGKLIQKK